MYLGLGFRSGGPHPVLVTIRENRDSIGFSYIPMIPLLQGGGGPPKIYRHKI